MAYNSSAVATQLVSILSGLSGMGSAQIGAPKQVGDRVHSFVTMGSLQTVRKTTGVMQRRARYFVMLVYRLDADEGTAETTLMGLADAFMAAVHADLTLSGTVVSADVASLAADEPEYQLRLGKEFRDYPMIVTVEQRDSYTVNP